MRKFWDGTKSSKGLFFFAYVSFFFSVIVNIFVPLYYKKFFDVLGSATDRTIVLTSLVHIILVILVFHALNWLLWRIGMYMYNLMQSRIMARLKQNSFDYMMMHSYTFFANSFSGGLVQKVNRFSRAFESLTDSVAFNIMPLIVTIIASVAITYFIAPIVSIIMIGWIVVFSTFNFTFSRWKLKYDLASAEADSKTSGYLADAITNNNAISFFTGHKYESGEFKNVSNDQAKKTRFTWQLGEVVDATQALLILIVEFLIFYYAIKYWSRGLITIGTFVLAQTYIIGLAQQLWGLNRVIRSVYQSIADSKEMVEILVKPYDIKDIPSAQYMLVSRGEIEFKNVSFNFNETRQVLKNINIKILFFSKKSRIYCIL